MEILKKYGGALALGGLAVVALGFLFMTNNSENGTSPDTSGITQVDLGGGVGIGVSGDGAIIKEVSSVEIKTPSLDRPVSFEGSALAPELHDTVREKIEGAVAALQKNSADLSRWLELGFFRHQAGDYRGAEEVWLYVNAVAEKDIVSTMNLGNLYMNSLKDYPKAEYYYRAALLIDSKNLDAYQNLYMLYKYLYKTNTSAAADVQKEALKAVPNEAAYISNWTTL